MDFLLKTENLQGGDTRKAPENTHPKTRKSRYTPEGKGPPHDTPSIPLIHGIQTNTPNPLNPF